MKISQQHSMVAVLLALTVLSTDAFKLFDKHRSSKRSKNHEKSDSNENKEYSSLISISTELPRTIEANLYETVELSCDATSSPSPTLHWLLNGSRIYREGERLIDDEAVYENTAKNQKHPLSNKGSTRSKLVLGCITPEDEGIYTCVAQTPMGRVVKSTKLVIANKDEDVEQSECMIKKQSLQQDEAPVIYMNTNMRFEREDADVQLFCRASGSPKPKVVWTMRTEEGDKVLNNHHKKFKVLPNGDLLIRSTSWTDMGSYICQAKNEIGEDQTETFFYPFAR